MRGTGKVQQENRDHYHGRGSTLERVTSSASPKFAAHRKRRNRLLEQLCSQQLSRQHRGGAKSPSLETLRLCDNNPYITDPETPASVI